MTRHRSLILLSSVLLIVLGVAGCAKDDGAATRAGCGGGAGSGSAAGSASAAGAAVGKPFTVTVTEWSVKAPASIKAGKVLLTVDNVGKLKHEIIVIEGVTPADIPTKADGAIDETELPKGAILGEIEGVGPGATCDGGFDLKPGTYTLACNLVTMKNGKEEVHFMEGMSTQMKVT